MDGHASACAACVTAGSRRIQPYTVTSDFQFSRIRAMVVPNYCHCCALYTTLAVLPCDVLHEQVMNHHHLEKVYQSSLAPTERLTFKS